MIIKLLFPGGTTLELTAEGKDAEKVLEEAQKRLLGDFDSIEPTISKK